MISSIRSKAVISFFLSLMVIISLDRALLHKAYADSSVFSDDFNDNSLDPAKWSIVYLNSTAVVSETGQRLQIALAPNTAAYNGIYSNSTFDLTGKSVQVEVAQPISQAGWCENFIQVALDGQNYFLIDAGAGSMVLRSMVNGVNDQTIIPTFDPVAHRYWRIRHDQNANTVNFDTSADGSSWTTRKTAAVAFSLTALRFYLYAGAWGTGNSNPGAVKYDNFQLVSSSAGGMMSNQTGSTTSEENIRFFKKVNGTDVATFGVGGLRGWNYGTLYVNNVFGTVRQAYLYWHGPTNSSEVIRGGTLFVNGVQVSGNLIGTSSDNTWDYANSRAYRADITSLVGSNPNKSYFLNALTDFPAFNANGASLVIFYDDGNAANDLDVSVFDGNDSNSHNIFDADGWNVTLSDIAYSSGQAQLELHVADGQNYVDPDVSLNSSLFLTGNWFQGFSVPSRDGFFSPENLWDKISFNITSYLSVGSNNLRLTSPAATTQLPVKDALSVVVALVKVPAIREVQTVTLEQINSVLDNNPNNGGGMRIFPDREFLSDNSIAKRKVRVKATTSLGPNRTVYFRAFDVDDPSTDTAPVDTNGNLGSDNRGVPQAGTLSASSAQTDANGVAILEFSTTMQPGDNFMVAASADQTYLNGIVVNATGLKDSTGASLPTLKAKPSSMLTVWRRMHIELDSMGPVSGNSVSGTITLVKPETLLYPNSQSSMYPAAGGRCGSPGRPCYDYTHHWVYVNTTLDSGRYGDSSGVVQAVLNVNNAAYDVLSNGTNWFYISTPNLTGPVAGSVFVVHDDDDFNSNDAVRRSDEGEDVEALSETFSLMQQNSDSPSQNIFAPAYIRPVYDGGGSLANNQSGIAFKLNVPTGTVNWDAQLNLGWNSEMNESDDFWIVYVQLGYQEDVSGDSDPNSQEAVGGVTGTYARTDDVTGSAGVPYGGDSSLVFLETQRDIDNRGYDLRKRTLPHEVGHQFGLKGDDTNVPEFGVMNPTGALTFGPRHLNVLRWRIKSPGFN